jgi:hypothetical protein
LRRSSLVIDSDGTVVLQLSGAARWLG